MVASCYPGFDRTGNILPFRSVAKTNMKLIGSPPLRRHYGHWNIPKWRPYLEFDFEFEFDRTWNTAITSVDPESGSDDP